MPNNKMPPLTHHSSPKLLNILFIILYFCCIIAPIPHLNKLAAAADATEPHNHCPNCSHRGKDSLQASIEISVAGMEAQLERMKVISQNIANANTSGGLPGADPYQRKVIIFKNEYDPKINGEKLIVDRIDYDKSKFTEIYQPDHPAADPDTGKVKLPNIDPIIETMDAKETQRSIEANVQLISIIKSEQKKIVELLK
jgi:flagellar basal-body rod protein FlgC